MPEVPVASLDTRQQKLVDNARLALERGNFDYTLEVTAQVLSATPGCLPVRKLQRVAQLRRHRGRAGGFMGRALSGLSTAPFMFTSGRRDPVRQLAAAEALLAKDPTNVGALKMLAEAAGGLGLPETVAFALDAVREIDPGNRNNLLALGEAWLAAGKPAEALRLADEILSVKPADTEAQDLMRKASIAHTVTTHHWDRDTPFREKLRAETQAVSVEPSVRTPSDSAVSQRLIDEALALVAREPNNLNHLRTIAQAYRQIGKFDEALHWVRKARQQSAGKSDALLEKQETELATAVIEQRVKHAETAVHAAPGDNEAKAKLAAAREELARFKLSEATRYAR